jgi:DNA-directed RNA polymerase specialized sigma24 family protein
MKRSLDDFNLSRQQVLDLIDSYIFHERNRQVLRRRLLDGASYEELADEFGLSVNHVKSVCYTAIQKLSSHI